MKKINKRNFQEFITYRNLNNAYIFQYKKVHSHATISSYVLQLITKIKDYLFGPLHIETYFCDAVQYFIKILNASNFLNNKKVKKWVFYILKV